MNINKIDNTHFCGIYKLPNTPQNAAKLIDKIDINVARNLNFSELQEYLSKQNVISEIKMLYMRLRHQPITAFIGETPGGKIIYDSILDMVAKDNNSSVQWLKMNAAIHKFDITNFPGSDSIYVINSLNDVNDLIKYMISKGYNTGSTVFSVIKNFFTGQTINRGIDPDLPEHLKVIARAKNVLENENENFAKKFVRGRVREVNDTNTLLNLMMSS